MRAGAMRLLMWVCFNPSNSSTNHFYCLWMFEGRCWQVEFAVSGLLTFAESDIMSVQISQSTNEGEKEMVNQMRVPSSVLAYVRMWCVHCLITRSECVIWWNWWGEEKTERGTQGANSLIKEWVQDTQFFLSGRHLFLSSNQYFPLLWSSHTI